MGLVLLIQTPYFESYGAMRKAAGTYFPLGLGYIASFMQNKGHEVILVDPNVQSMVLGNLDELFRKRRPGLVGISFMTPQYNSALRIAAMVKRVSSDIKVVVGGAHPSALPEETLAKMPAVDYLVFGEGEETIFELVEFLSGRGGGNPAEIKGLAWRKGDRVVLNSPRELMDKLDSLPFPARELVDQRLYRQQSFLSSFERAANIITSRGCPGRCVFCASGHKLRTKVRIREFSYVFDEIRLLRQRYGINYLMIKDDTFTLSRARIKDFCESYKRQNPDLKFHCMGRVDTVDYNILSIMKDAGLNDIFFGLESGNDNILKSIGKGFNTSQAAEAIKDCERLGIRTYGAFILGLPGDNPDTIRQTVEFARSLPLTMAGFSVLIPYPGTMVYETHYKPDPRKPVNYDNFVGSSGLCYVPEYTGVTGLDVSELPGLVSYAQKRFYLRPRQILRMLKYANSTLLSGYARGALALVHKEILLRVNKGFRGGSN
jgi:anaerobic magnesium-protoporphyrin IX monomethyl ester cyclase